MKDQGCIMGRKVEWLPRSMKKISVEKGSLWITDKEGRDILLSSGESVTLGRGPCLAQGLEKENRYRGI